MLETASPERDSVGWVERLGLADKRDTHRRYVQMMGIAKRRSTHPTLPWLTNELTID
jgi:hypothetical protein